MQNFRSASIITSISAVVSNILTDHHLSKIYGVGKVTRVLGHNILNPLAVIKYSTRQKLLVVHLEGTFGSQKLIKH